MNYRVQPLQPAEGEVVHVSEMEVVEVESGKRVATGHLEADYVSMDPGTLISVGVRFVGQVVK